MALKGEVPSVHTWERLLSFVKDLMKDALVYLRDFTYQDKSNTL